VPPEFVPGVELARRFYAEVVGPLVAGRAHSAAFVGTGSDVLGLDTERSTDHGWGPRLQLFLAGAEVEPVRTLLDDRLPETFCGWAVRYGWDDVPVAHHVETAERGAWFRSRLGFDPCEPVSTLDWLTASSQTLLELRSGAVFRDEGGELARARGALEWYPRDVWLWLLASQWRRIAQEEAFVGRAAEVGDELGSRVVAARLARDLMRLCFLVERRYAPYSKWLGTAFARLDSAPEVGPALQDALAATAYPARETALVRAYEAVAKRFNALGVAGPQDPSVRPFYTRPYLVLSADRFASACLAAVEDEQLRRLPLVGAVDQLADSTDVLTSPELARRLGALYERG
jgi:Domain of unknown function (DUF4037)